MSFRCTQCGSCCRRPGYVYVSADDIAAMADACRISEDLFIARYTELAPNRAQLCLVARRDGSCVFLSGNQCAVYAVRPAQCRMYPYSWGADHECPGNPGA